MRNQNSEHNPKSEPLFDLKQRTMIQLTKYVTLILTVLVLIILVIQCTSTNFYQTRSAMVKKNPFKRMELNDIYELDGENKKNFVNIFNAQIQPYQINVDTIDTVKVSFEDSIDGLVAKTLFYYYFIVRFEKDSETMTYSMNIPFEKITTETMNIPEGMKWLGKDIISQLNRLKEQDENFYKIHSKMEEESQITIPVVDSNGKRKNLHRQTRKTWFGFVQKFTFSWLGQ